MRKTLALVIVAVVVLATSCVSIIEELTLNSDGSGTYTYKIDMSTLIESGVMGQARQMSEDVPEDVLEVDTVMGAYDMLKENGTLADMDKPDFWKKVRLESVISESRGIGEISFILDFDDISEVGYFSQNLGKLLESDETAGMLSSMGLTNSGMVTPIAYKKGLFGSLLTRKGEDSEVNEMAEMLEEDGGEMVKMMLSGAEYITIYNLPGKVKKVSHDDAKVSNDGKTVTISADLLDQMEGKADLSTTIKFKNK